MRPSGDFLIEDAGYAAVEWLETRGLMEWGSVDPGSINLATFAES